MEGRVGSSGIARFPSPTVIKEILQGLRIEGNLHQLKKTFISHSLMLGMSITEVARITGTRVMTIERYYGSLASEHLRNVIERLDYGK
ncbi:hypothetical protein ISS37_07980 [candidate division KSB1 bacterium]|nr:hypothetical protein [candidate division KSB1 bacterium]